MKRRIILFTIYVGPLPEHFPLWLISCSFNKNIRWHLFTDQDISHYEVPENVVFQYMNLKIFSQLAKDFLGLQCPNLRPYKFCDFRPTYGFLFQQQCKDFDYWGHCDLDLIFGDLETMFANLSFWDYEKVLGLGHLTLYRNNEKVNNAFRLVYKGLDWRTIMSTMENIGFDEHHGINEIFRQNGLSQLINEHIVADICPLYPDLLMEFGRNYQRQLFFWSAGKTYQLYIKWGCPCLKEFAYIHFQKRKMPIDMSMPFPNSFAITKDGIVECCNPPTFEQIESGNKHTTRFPFRLLKNRVKRRLRF